MLLTSPDQHQFLLLDSARKLDASHMSPGSLYQYQYRNQELEAETMHANLMLQHELALAASKAEGTPFRKTRHSPSKAVASSKGGTEPTLKCAYGLDEEPGSTALLFAHHMMTPSEVSLMRLGHYRGAAV